MKFKFDHAYLEKIKYITLGFVILYVIYKIINELGLIIGYFHGAFSFILAITSPFLWGIVIAYLMNPIVKYLESMLTKIKLPQFIMTKYNRQKKYTIRGISLIITLLLFCLIIFLMVYSVYVMINGSFREFELKSFLEGVSNYMMSYSQNLKSVEQSLEDMGINTNFFQVINNYMNTITGSFTTILEDTGAKLALIGKYIINISFGFVFAFNFIMNREYFYGLIENMLRLFFIKESKRAEFKEVVYEIHEVFMHFIRGRIIDLTLLSFVTSLSLMLLKYDYPLIVGAFAGYTNIIPFLGSYIGIIPPMIISFVTGGWKDAIFIGLYILAIQQVYIVLVSPKIQGKSIGMHPVFVLLSIFLFGNLFGLIGIILAIPFGGVVRIFILRWVRKRQEKKGIELVEFDKKLDKNVEMEQE